MTSAQARTALPPHLHQLEAEAIFVMREVAAEFERPVMLYSIGKDSSVMLHLALKAFYPAVPPFPLLHVDTTWKFKEMIAFRDRAAKRAGMDLIVHINQDGVRRGISPVASGSQVHTQIMKTESLRQALDEGKYDVAFGGARRDEEMSARQGAHRLASDGAGHGLGPAEPAPRVLAPLQRPGDAPASRCASSRCRTGPNYDVWLYIAAQRASIPVVPLYFAKPLRPTVERDGTLLMVDDAARMPLQPPARCRAWTAMIRFRSLGCWPLSGAVPSSTAADAARA